MMVSPTAGSDAATPSPSAASPPASGARPSHGAAGCRPRAVSPAQPSVMNSRAIAAMPGSSSSARSGVPPREQRRPARRRAATRRDSGTSPATRRSAYRRAAARRPWAAPAGPAPLRPRRPAPTRCPRRSIHSLQRCVQPRVQPRVQPLTPGQRHLERRPQPPPGVPVIDLEQRRVEAPGSPSGSIDWPGRSSGSPRAAASAPIRSGPAGSAGGRDPFQLPGRMSWR